MRAVALPISPRSRRCFRRWRTAISAIVPAMLTTDVASGIPQIPRRE